MFCLLIIAVVVILPMSVSDKRWSVSHSRSLFPPSLAGESSRGKHERKVHSDIVLIKWASPYRALNDSSTQTGSGVWSQYSTGSVLNWRLWSLSFSLRLPIGLQLITYSVPDCAAFSHTHAHAHTAKCYSYTNMLVEPPTAGVGN